MNVTLVSPFDPEPDATASGVSHVGGVERVFANFSSQLARRGHEVRLVCSSPRAGQTTLSNGVMVTRVRREATIFRTPMARLASALTKDTDLIHVAATYPFTTVPVLRRATALGVPSVLDFHFEPVLDGWAGRASTRLYGMVGPRNYAMASAVLVRSRSYARACPGLARVPEAAWRVVPNGVDPIRFRPMSESEQGSYLLFVGRLVSYKGISTLLHAMALEPPGLPLLIAGDGPLRKELEHLARTLRVPVSFLGRVAEEELPGLYRGARLTLLPSINSQEAFGITLLESMACGTPVVASDLPGVAEIAALGGRIAPPGDALALGQQIRQASALGALVRGRALAAPIRSAYSWDAVADRLVNVYEEILRSGQPRAAVKSSMVVTNADPRGDAIL